MKLPKWSFLFGILLVLAALAWQAALPAMAQADKATALIQAVNQLRASNGYYAYKSNDHLMASAQGQSDYQATLVTATHVGSGGTDVTQRAIAAGYGGGATVHCVENVAWAFDFTPQAAVASWNDSIHLATMLSSKYVDVGAGATTDDQGRTFYTLDVCYIEGVSQPAATQLAPASAATATAPAAGGTPATQTATPNLSGSNVYVVQEGDTLTAIAKKFGITLSELLALNNLQLTSVIYPGEKLLVSPPVSATPTSPSTATPTPATPTPPPPTLPPTNIPTKTSLPVTPTLTLTATLTAVPVLPGLEGDATGSYMVIGAVVLALAGAGLIAWGAILRRRSS